MSDVIASNTYLILVSKPVYMGVYVAVDAADKAHAVAKVREALNEEPLLNEQTLYEKLMELFGEMRVSAHHEVTVEHNGMVNAMSDSGFEVIGDAYHDELDVDGVLGPDNVEELAQKSYPTDIAIDLTTTVVAA